MDALVIIQLAFLCYIIMLLSSTNYQKEEYKTQARQAREQGEDILRELIRVRAMLIKHGIDPDGDQ